MHVFQVLKRPVITEKSTVLQEQNKYVFRGVAPREQGAGSRSCPASVRGEGYQRAYDSHAR